MTMRAQHNTQCNSSGTPRRAFLMIFLVLFAIVGAGMGWVADAGHAHAQPQSRSQARQNAVAQDNGHVTIIVLDMSGSMATNDPNGIRCSAADAYIDLSGIGSYIGVIGLDNNSGARGGPHNFQTAMPWAEPSEMATVPQHHALEAAIASKSNNCAPDSNTPTYDALNQALTMLESATHNSQLSGSVILLTDGQPAPDGPQQISAIQSDLVPQFRQHNWPVDAIALGTQADFRFLATIANATSGKFYDDAQGVVQNGASGSPLNIAPFFVDIFAQRNRRTPGPTVPPTSLNGASTSREFQVGSYVDKLDVVAIKDQPGTQITLTAPNGQTITPITDGAYVALDPYQHYVVYTINGPQQGYWTFTITGSGSFLMDSLITSSLKVNVLSPASDGTAQALGQDFTVKATVEDTTRGTQLTGSSDYTVKAIISFAGELPFGAANIPQIVQLSDAASSGTYQGKVNIPQTARPGSYEIAVAVYGVTNVIITHTPRFIRL